MTTECRECGMLCEAGEYHPFAACVMYKVFRNADSVRLNIKAIQEYGPICKPIPTKLRCNVCDAIHIDRDEWATRPHKTHLCEHCGNEWRPYPVSTVGV